MIEVRRGCLARRRSPQPETQWYQRTPRTLPRHHRPRAPTRHTAENQSINQSTTTSHHTTRRI